MKRQGSSIEFDTFVSYSGPPDMARLFSRRLSRVGGSPWRLRRRRGLNVYFDREWIRTGDELPAAISEAIKNSSYFVLLASRAAAGSKWVSKELQIWLSHKPASGILIVVLDGILAWDDERADFDWGVTDCLPPILKGKFEKEHCWPDLRGVSSSRLTAKDKARLRDTALSTAARIKGVDKHELDSADKRDRVRFRRAVMIVMLSLIVSAFVTVSLARRVSRIPLDDISNQGWTHLAQRENFSQVKDALACFDNVLERDPGHERALLGKAFALTLLLGYGGSERESARVLAEAEEALSRVGRTDTSEYYHVKGRMLLYKDLNVLGARRLLEQAVRLDPDDIEARHSLASTYTFLGEHRQAEELCNRALVVALEISGGKKDRRYTRALALLAWTYFHAGQYDRAKDLCGKILESEDPTNDLAERYLGHIFMQQRDYQNAIKKFEAAGGNVIKNTNLYANLTCAHALSGDLGEARKRARELVGRAQSGVYVSPYRLAQCYACMGETEKALEQLRRARSEGDIFVVWSAVDPLLSSLRGTAEFDDYLRSVGLERAAVHPGGETVAAK